uniref:Uncharacterized protein n=1 Tax=Tanacetum cinerariifolium TaxID=118510 RepID=A0A6L2KEZ7_TANCI|nr:hypothetical protein [Tanacetum cinerariifolium]
MKIFWCYLYVILLVLPAVSHPPPSHQQQHPPQLNFYLKNSLSANDATTAIVLSIIGTLVVGFACHWNNKLKQPWYILLSDTYTGSNKLSRSSFGHPRHVLAKYGLVEQAPLTSKNEDPVDVKFILVITIIMLAMKKSGSFILLLRNSHTSISISKHCNFDTMKILTIMVSITGAHVTGFACHCAYKKEGAAGKTTTLSGSARRGGMHLELYLSH